MRVYTTSTTSHKFRWSKSTTHKRDDSDVYMENRERVRYYYYTRIIVLSTKSLFKGNFPARKYVYGWLLE